MSSSYDTHLFTRNQSDLVNLIKGERIYVWDAKGKKYLDASGGPLCVNIGYGVQEVKAAIKAQMNKICYVHGSHFITESVKECAEKLANFSLPGLKHIFFCNGGSEATEAAAKLARQYHLLNGESSRYKVIARWQSYHGNTLGALSISGNIARRRKFVNMLLDFPHIPPAYCYRCPYDKDPDSCNLECAHALEREIKANGPQYISAFMAEPIVGATLGTYPAPEGYFQIIREICDRYDILFIADEVMTGFGRTGKNWGIEHWDVKPDIITAAKGMSSGYLPLGATIASGKIYDTFSEPFIHGHTYGSHPMGCAAGSACIEFIMKHKLVKNAANLAKNMFKRLEELYEHPTVGDVRGLGLFAGIEFVKDKNSKEPFNPEKHYNNKIFRKCQENGLLVYPGSASVDGFRGDHIQIGPPLVIIKEEVDVMMDLLDRSIREAERQML
jgi:adenosylmethionine-8-amino-7-oxononanoate aminotransferase